MKGKILFDIYPFKQGDIIEIPYENKSLEKIKGWQLWQVYEGDIDGYKGIVIVEKNETSYFEKINFKKYLTSKFKSGIIDYCNAKK